MHGPCGVTHPASPCMKGGPRCTKRHPRAFCDETIQHEHGYPIDRRKVSTERNGDRTTAVMDVNGNEVPREINEIAGYLDARYVSAPEGIWRIFKFKKHNRHPAVQRLQIRLPNQQTVAFNNDTDMVTFLQNERLRKTTLTEFFTANRQTADADAARAEDDPPSEFDCRELLYQEFPSQMTWDAGNRRWKRRQRGRDRTIGRMYFVGPSGGERFYLRLLLTTVRGPTSFNDLRTFNGVQYDNFKAACIAHGLLDSDEQRDRSLAEVALWQSGSQLRELFVCILLHCQPANPLRLWIDHAQSLSDDCRHRLQTIHQIDDPAQEQVIHFYYKSNVRSIH